MEINDENKYRKLWVEYILIMRQISELNIKLSMDIIVDLFRDFFTLIFAVRDEIEKYYPNNIDMECANSGIDCYQIILSTIYINISKNLSEDEKGELQNKTKSFGKYDNYNKDNLSERFKNGVYLKIIDDNSFSIFNFFR